MISRRVGIATVVLLVLSLGLFLRPLAGQQDAGGCEFAAEPDPGDAQVQAEASSLRDAEAMSLLEAEAAIAPPATAASSLSVKSSLSLW